MGGFKAPNLKEITLINKETTTMARPKKLLIKLADGKDILFNNKYNEELASMNDRLYKRYLASKQFALKNGLKNIKNRLNTLSLNDFDTIKEYNNEYSNLKHYMNVVADYIKEVKRDYDLYFNASVSVDELLSV